MASKNLLFRTHAGGLTICWDHVIGWQNTVKREPVTVPHSNPTLASKGEVEPSGRVRIVPAIGLFVKGMPPLLMDPDASAEFLQFVDERVSPEIWQAKEPGKPEIIEMDAPVGEA